MGVAILLLWILWTAQQHFQSPPRDVVTPLGTHSSFAEPTVEDIAHDPPQQQSSIVPLTSTVQGVIDWKSLPMNRNDVPKADWSAHGFRHIVFGVLSDGILEHRLRAAFESWLRDSFHTFVYFSDVPLSRRSVNAFHRDNVSVVLLTPPPSFHSGNWKNLPIVQHFSSPDAQQVIQRTQRLRPTADAPLWYVIVDDDSYLLQPAVAFVLQKHNARLKVEPQANVFAGHTVVRCQRCRNAHKRFSFAFGGNGIFLSTGLMMALAARVPECSQIFSILPGDEQVGGCIHKFSLAKLDHLSVGTETFAMPFGDKTEVLLESPFPFAFHRITIPEWHKDMSRLEKRHPGRILSWPTIAEYFMDELRETYNREEHVFRETRNESKVQSYLRMRKQSDTQ